MGQTKIQSAVETAVGLAIGFSVAWTIQVLLFPLYDIEISHGQHAQITLVFTIASVIRSYYVRRLFNWYHTR
jgi:hypothetical protein